MSGYVLDASVAVTALTAPGSPAAHLLSGATRPSRFRRFSMPFGIAGSTVSQRGYQVIQAAGLQLADDTSVIRPASPDLLVSERRRQIIDQRDQYRAATEG